MKTLNEQFRAAIADKEALCEKHEKDLKNLKRLERRSSALEIFWNEDVNAKSAVRAIQGAQILLAFKKSLETRTAFSRLDEVELSTHQLWRLTQLATLAVNLSPTSNFRSHLNWLKNKGYLTFLQEARNWRLTPKAMERIPRG